MENTFSKHESNYIFAYGQKGYSTNFHFNNGVLVSGETDTTYKPKDIHVVAEHRFEGMSNPSDLSILYIVETNEGEKGTVLMAYGPNGDMEQAEFFKKIPESQISDKENIDEN